MRAFIHNYTKTEYSSRRDGESAVYELTDRVLSAQWSLSVRDPYERAQVRTSIRIDELDLLGLGSPRRPLALPALHCSGWLELRDNDKTVFFGVISQVTTGLSVDERGSRRSQGVSLTADSWVSILARPFRLSERTNIIDGRGVIDYEAWARIFEVVFSRGAVVDVAEGFKSAWSELATYAPPNAPPFSSYPILTDAASLALRFPTLLRSMTRVLGRNISQIPTAGSGSLWSTFLQSFAPAPQLIELFPARHRGHAHIIHRMKPLPPRVVAGYFGGQDAMIDFDAPEPKTAHRAPAYRDIVGVISYQLTYQKDRNNYIEVTSPYLGASQLAGLGSAPYSASDDVLRYGLYPLEIPYPLLRASEIASEGAIREAIESLTEYAAALYSEAHAFAVASVECAYAPDAVVGEWVRWADYSEGANASVMVGYPHTIQHQIIVREHGQVTRRTSISLERVSQYGRPAAKYLVRGSVTGEFVEETL